MPNPKYQTRLPPDHAEQVDEYADERGISKAEAVRRLIVAGLDTTTAEADNVTGTGGDAAADKEERTRKLGQLGERFMLTGIGFAFLAAFVLIGSTAAITQFGLTTGTFGISIITWGATLCMTASAISLGVGTGLIAETVIRQRVTTGWFGRRLDNYLGSKPAVGA
jgi:hypothetical protein